MLIGGAMLLLLLGLGLLALCFGERWQRPRRPVPDSVARPASIPHSSAKPVVPNAESRLRP